MPTQFKHVYGDARCVCTNCTARREKLSHAISVGTPNGKPFVPRRDWTFQMDRIALRLSGEYTIAQLKRIVSDAEAVSAVGGFPTDEIPLVL